MIFISDNINEEFNEFILETETIIKILKYKWYKKNKEHQKSKKHVVKISKT